MPHDTGSYGQYSVPTEQQQQPNLYENMDAYYPTSDANMDVYTSSSSLVIRNDGRTVRSTPGMASTTLVSSYSGERHHHRPTSYSEVQLPLSVYSSQTLIIPEDTQQVYKSAFNSSNAPMTLVSPLTGGLSDDHPNEMCNSRNSNRQKLQERIDSQHSIPSDPLSANSFQPGYSASATSEGYEFSNGFHYGASNMDIGECSGPSHMVTGLGGGVGGGGGGGEGVFDDVFQLMDSMDPLLPQCSPVAVFDDDTNVSDLLRKLEEPPHSLGPSDLVIPPELEAFQAIDSHFLSATICSDYMGEPVQVQPQEKIAPESHSWNQSSESPHEQSSIGDDLVMIKMMGSKNNVVPPQSLNLREQRTHREQEGGNNIISATATSVSVKSEYVIPSPCPPTTPLSATPYRFQPQTPIAPVQVSAPSPARPPTPMTPATPCPPSRIGPFEINSYKYADDRVLDVSISSDIPDEMKKVAYEMNCFSLDRCLKYEECLRKTFDLNMAINARAEMCKFDFDRRTGKLSFSMPKDCMHLDKWLRVHHGDADLLDRQLVVQQVANFLASIHSCGSADKLCLWGSFVVWVAPSKQVYVMVDFPVMLKKMEDQSMNIMYDPRMDDVKALYDLYKSVFEPFINHDSSWISPGVKQLLCSFETLISDPTSVYRMAELARTLGERRLCKLEVEIMTIFHSTYCIEHEPLRKVLSHFEHMLPQVKCDRWDVQWLKSHLPVGHDVVASAQRRMQLRVTPVSGSQISLAEADQHILSFKQE